MQRLRETGKIPNTLEIWNSNKVEMKLYFGISAPRKTHFYKFRTGNPKYLKEIPWSRLSQPLRAFNYWEFYWESFQWRQWGRKTDPGFSLRWTWESFLWAAILSKESNFVLQIYKQIELCYMIQIPIYCSLANKENKELIQNQRQKQSSVPTDLSRLILMWQRIWRRNDDDRIWRRELLIIVITNKHLRPARHLQKNPDHVFDRKILFKARNIIKGRIVEGLFIQRLSPSLSKQIKCFIVQLFPRGIT